MTKNLNLLLFIQSLIVTLVGLSSPAQTVNEIRSGYLIQSDRLCGNLPKVQIQATEGYCIGLLASKNDGLKMPRYATQANDGTIYISDMHGWAYGKGTVFALELSDDNKSKKLTNLFPNSKLTTPNGIAVDPEGRVYVGLPTGVFRFNPKNNDGSFIIDPKLEPIFTDIASSIFRKEEYASASNFNSIETKFKNKHPLIQIAANSSFTELYVNVGAPSDDCGSGIKTINEKGLCIQAEAQMASSAVWKISLQDNSERLPISATVFSRGLRNSMALAVHPISNIVIQGENGIDLKDEDKPYEELNVLKEGSHYGWPYCHSSGEVSPHFKNKISPKDCLEKYNLPKVFMPAHTAPLGILYPKLPNSPLSNTILISWHGYKPSGHKVVSYPVDEQGIPTSNQYTEVLSNWEALEGVRPRGAPTGLLQLNDQKILVVDDKNGALLVLSEGSSHLDKIETEKIEFSADSIEKFDEVFPMLKTNCSICHVQFQNDANTALRSMQGSMLNLTQPLDSPIWLKLNSGSMPPESIKATIGYNDSTRIELLSKIKEFLHTLNRP